MHLWKSCTLASGKRLSRISVRTRTNTSDSRPTSRSLRHRSKMQSQSKINQSQLVLHSISDSHLGQMSLRSSRRTMRLPRTPSKGWRKGYMTRLAVAHHQRMIERSKPYQASLLQVYLHSIHLFPHLLDHQPSQVHSLNLLA